MKNNYLSTGHFFVATLLFFLCVDIQMSQAQSGVRIARTTGTADPSAVLDVVSDGTPTWKGFLLPRMTSAAKLAIPTPATGLLIYQTDGSTGLYYYNGSAWVQLSAGALSGAGTTNTLAKWTSASGIGNSQLVDDGTNVGIGIASPTQKFQVVGGNVQINNLAGTGLRQVYADANGILKAVTSTPVTFTYTGANQTYTVPAGVTTITIKLWGAGGGGGYYGGWSNGFSGGGGGFTQANLTVTPGQILTIIVGQGGTGGNIANTAVAYGGGGISCFINSDCRYGAQGGGRSAILNASSVELLTAGGGGGGGSNTFSWTSGSRGGAGGGATGQTGECQSATTTGGGGGTQSAGGIAGVGANGVGSVGVQPTGGHPTTNAYGGGGGGGWWGGGGGAFTNGNVMGGGGGGSGYIGGAGVTNGVTIQGNYNYPAGTGDFYYQGGVGLGGTTIYPTATPNSGGNGLVVIIPN